MAHQLRSRGVSFTVLVESSAKALTDRLPAALDGCTGALVVGGDGLLHTLLQHASFRSLPFTVFPAGTGNDFASHIRAGAENVSHLDATLAALEKGEVTRVDALTVQPENAGVDAPPIWVAGSVAFGLAARVNRRANQARFLRGSLAYQWALLRELATGRIDTYHCDAGSVDALLISVFNLPSFGGGIRLAPSASPTDGLLDVVRVDPASRRRVFSLLPTLQRAEHETLPEVHITHETHLRLGLPGHPVFGDGEYLCDGVVEVRLRPHALRVVGFAPAEPTLL